jgi:hypothetical protein
MTNLNQTKGLASKYFKTLSSESFSLVYNKFIYVIIIAAKLNFIFKLSFTVLDG